MHYISCVLMNTEHWTIFSCFFWLLGSMCMYILFVTNPAVSAKSNKPLLLSSSNFSRQLTNQRSNTAVSWQSQLTGNVSDFSSSSGKSEIQLFLQIQPSPAKAKFAARLAKFLNPPRSDYRQLKSIVNVSLIVSCFNNVVTNDICV